MNRIAVTASCMLLACSVCVVDGKEISGEYIEARTCDVYTGPCFANGEVGISGKEAPLAWQVEEGGWEGESLAGLGVALVVKANDTLGFGGSFNTNPTEIAAVLLVDERATAGQQRALASFVRGSITGWTPRIIAIKPTALRLESDHLSGKGTFVAGDFAKIETRRLGKRDCVCSNEVVFYPPLTTVENAHPVYTLQLRFEGDGLNSRWKTINRRSAFLATFSK